MSSTSETGASEFSESGESSDSEYSTSKVINTTDERIFPDTPLDQIQKRMLLCVQRDDRGSLALNVERKRHNLLDLRNRGVDVFHYSFHVYFNERHYYFDSRERPDAGIRLTQLGAMKQVHKHIELMDLSIRMVFYVHRVFLRQVEMRVYVRPEGADLDNMDTPVRTVFVDKDSRRHHLLSASGCDRLWEEQPELNTPVMPMDCQPNEDESPHEEPVHRDNDVAYEVLRKCPSSATSGELRLPEALEKDARVRVQANHCFRGWLGEGGKKQS